VHEAFHQGYDGLHQWNFGADNGAFILSSRKERIDVTRALLDRAIVLTHIFDRRWIVNTIIKHPLRAA
jgi:hypothetical protein